MSKHNATGRSKTDRFVALPLYMLKSPAWISLSPPARAMLIEVMAFYNGRNNGFIGMSARTGAERTGCSKDTVSRALHELQESGFIEVSVPGIFCHRRHATEWRLTLYKCDRTGAPPSKDFMRRKTTEIGSEKLFLSPTTGTDSPCGDTPPPENSPKRGAVVRPQGLRAVPQSDHRDYKAISQSDYRDTDNLPGGVGRGRGDKSSPDTLAVAA